MVGGHLLPKRGDLLLMLAFSEGNTRHMENFPQGGLSAEKAGGTRELRRGRCQIRHADEGINAVSLVAEFQAECQAFAQSLSRADGVAQRSQQRAKIAERVGDALPVPRRRRTASASS